MSASGKRKGAIAVTGASRGIGAAIAVELARKGYTVACLTRAGKGIEGRAPRGKIAERLLAEPCDITDDKSVARALRNAAERAGGLRGLVNNAGIHHTRKSETLPTAELEKILRTNVTGTFVVCREAYPLLVANGGGRIINIGSYYERLGVPHSLAYTVSKAAVGALTRGLAVEWAPRNIIVLNVAPGIISTDMNRVYLERPTFRAFVDARIPLPGPGDVRDVAHMVAMLFSERVKFMTGETIFMDGGQSIAH